MERFKNAPPYDPEAGPWPINYSDEEKQAQREAGKDILEKLHEAVEEGRHEFHIPEGIYRVDKALIVDGCHGFHVKAANVEIIAEGDAKPEHFRSAFYIAKSFLTLNSRSLISQADG